MWRRILGYIVGVIVIVVMKRLLMVKGVVFVLPRKKRSFSTCISSVMIHAGTKSYVMTGWVSNYNPWVDSSITIGNYCSINSVSFILNGDAGHNHGILCSTYQWRTVQRKRDKRSRIVIGNDVWIGQDVLILGGVTIGDGAIVGAGSLVTRDVEPYTIVAGNPCRVIRTRYTDEQIKKLLKLKWWSIEDIDQFADEFQDLEVDEQIRLMKRIRRRTRHLRPV
jgi:acetyltransferase-like isoleucine patch superfamily enzyme